MTDFQSATLAAQQAALWIAAVGAAASVVSAAAATVAAVGIWHGIRAMVRANKERAAILDQQRQADERRHEEVMSEGARRHEEVMSEGARRHEEAMTESARRHEEAMSEGARRHEEAMAALGGLIGGLERQTASLETVVERTAPKPGPAE